MSDSNKARPLLIFGFFTLDAGRRVLQRINHSGAITETRLSSAESLILVELLEQAGQICSKDGLLNVGWEGKPISPNSLTVAIANLRRYLSSPTPEVEIRSIPKKGYMLSLFVPLRERVIEVVDDADEPQMPQRDIPEPQSTTAGNDTLVSDGLASSEPSVETPAPTGNEAPLHAARWHLPHWSGRRVLIWLNLLSLVLLFALILFSQFEWLHVTCREQAGFSVCIMDEKHPFTPEAKAGLPAADTLWLVSGKQAIALSKSGLLHPSGEDDDAE
ncbi:winged helix-turn-helix domain-containing protein [Aeromonas allosaccharophila]|uniref:Winged helix-turn-helix domain-containing protein n=1 Tax=Aeromonas allosaccharophila TaxID=656 RepID=A0ABZ0FDB9_9GAMM|nr:winged helix-turn-helix domain-containing protein [Aeromonas allosaccharophila]WOE67602.1 winged helix-turn-helix domain-containing protein [Aeromonas allosaccharophila]